MLEWYYLPSTAQLCRLSVVRLILLLPRYRTAAYSLSLALPHHYQADADDGAEPAEPHEGIIRIELGLAMAGDGVVPVANPYGKSL
jgi:hypothetical protein